VLQRYNLLQHVPDATYDGGNYTLDTLLTPIDDAALLSPVTVHPTCFSDHYTVACQLHQPRNVSTAVKYQFRDLRRVDTAALQRDVYRSPLYDFNRATSTDEYVQLFNSEMRRILDVHAPLKTRTRRAGRNDCRWRSVEARDVKRRLERRYRRSLAANDKANFQAARAAARKAIAITKRFADVAGDHAATWRVTRDVLHRGKRLYFSDTDCRSLVDDFSQFFSDTEFHRRRHT